MQERRHRNDHFPTIDCLGKGDGQSPLILKPQIAFDSTTDEFHDEEHTTYGAPFVVPP